jgi:hypothetical protein
MFHGFDKLTNKLKAKAGVGKFSPKKASSIGARLKAAMKKKVGKY